MRPAFADNVPKIVVRGRTIHVNGLYRHGFLIAPALARRAVAVLLEGRHFPELMGKQPSAEVEGFMVEAW